MRLVKRTEIERPVETFNLHIRDDHNYVAAGAVVANCHSAKGATLRELLGGPLSHVPIRWGMTGTIPKGEWEWWPLLCGLGPVVGEVQARDLQERGVLADCHVDVMVLADDHVGFRSYPEEYDYLVTDKARLGWIAEMVRSWTEESGNTLVLVDRIETGEALAALTPGSVFIQGSMSGKKRAIEWEAVATVSNKSIYATYGTAAVGINAPRLFNIVLLEPGKSFVRVIQSIGRGLRRAHDKSSVRITDLSSSLKFSARHRTKRLSFYAEAQYPTTVAKVDWRR